MDWNLLLQIAGVALGLLYLWLEYRADIRLWIVGLVMPAVHGALYFRSGLYADCSMQLYYIAAGLYGWAVWRRAAQRKGADRTDNRTDDRAAVASPIRPTPWRYVPGLVAAYAALHGARSTSPSPASPTARSPSGTASPRRSASSPTGCSRAS